LAPASGVDESTSVLPSRWRDRLVLIQNENTMRVRGLRLEVRDLAIAKLVAGREKGLAFLRDLIRHKIAQPGTLHERLAETTLDEVRRGLPETGLATAGA
jgi:hypothetical protein